MSAQPVEEHTQSSTERALRAVPAVGAGRRSREDAGRPVSRPSYVGFDTTVSAVRELSPHFLRITVTGEDLVHFSPAGLDQRIKLFLPRADGTVPDVGLFAEPAPSVMEWYTRWRELDESERNPIRTYTVRAARPEAREIDIDVVRHGTDGPASAWALAARVGDRLVVIGPDARSEEVGAGVEWNPGAAQDVLLAGDETAVPAICAILEQLPEGVHGEAYLEVPSSEDVLPVAARCGVQVTWLGRDGAAPGEKLGAAVQDWGRRRAEIFAERAAACRPARDAVGAPETGELPRVEEDGVLWEVAEPEGFREYAWLAGEAGVITALRRHLVKDIGMSRKQVSFMGYWKRGRASA